MPVVIVRFWWLLALRAAAAICIGLLSATDTFGSVTVLVALFTLLAVVEGGCLLAQARATGRGEATWRLAVAEAVPSVLVVLLVVFGPARTVPVLSWVVVAWIVTRGTVGLLGVLIQRRPRVDRLKAAEAIWALGFGLWVVLDPGPDGLTAITWLGTYVTGAGVLQLFRAAGARLAPAGREALAAWRWPGWLVQPQLLRLRRPRSRAASWPLPRPRQK